MEEKTTKMVSSQNTDSKNSLGARDEDCLFCKIVYKEVPATIVAETAQTLAFMDINPKEKGHVLLIPKAHFPWMQDAPDETIALTFIEAKRIMQSLKTALSADFVTVSVVGKDVPHFHVHLIPSHFRSPKKIEGKIEKKSAEIIYSYEEGELTETAEAIKKLL